MLGMTDTRQAYGYTPLRKTSTNAEERDQLSKFSWLSFVLHVTFWKKKNHAHPDGKPPVATKSWQNSS